MTVQQEHVPVPELAPVHATTEPSKWKPRKWERSSSKLGFTTIILLILVVGLSIAFGIILYDSYYRSSPPVHEIFVLKDKTGQKGDKNIENDVPSPINDYQKDGIVRTGMSDKNKTRNVYIVEPGVTVENEIHITTSPKTKNISWIDTTVPTADVNESVDVVIIETEVEMEVEEERTDYLLFSRAAWGAMPPLSGTPLEHPVPYVVISESGGQACHRPENCAWTMQFLQSYDMNNEMLPDIAVNFYIGGDGNVYTGRGWNATNYHTGFVRRKNIGIRFLGSYDREDVSETQFEVLQLLLNLGMKLGVLDPNYKLLAHNQIALPGSLFLGPGQYLLRAMGILPHRCYMNCDVTTEDRHIAQRGS